MEMARRKAGCSGRRWWCCGAARMPRRAIARRRPRSGRAARAPRHHPRRTQLLPASPACPRPQQPVICRPRPICKKPVLPGAYSTSGHRHSPFAQGATRGEIRFLAAAMQLAARSLSARAAVKGARPMVAARPMVKPGESTGTRRGGGSWHRHRALTPAISLCRILAGLLPASHRGLCANLSPQAHRIRKLSIWKA